MSVTTLYVVEVLLRKVKSLGEEFSWSKKDIILFVKHTEEVAATLNFVTLEKSEKKKQA